MKRREFVERVGMGSAALISAGGSVAAATRAQEGHDHSPLNGPLANATVSFGGWPATYDRNNPPVTVPPGPPPNFHGLQPNIVLIKAGGTVNYIIAGLHQIAVYGNGTKPEDINPNILINNPAPFPPFIDDSTNRVFKGITPIGPTGIPNLDRVEVVQFPDRGLYLVICAVRPHFVNDKMYGWVRVLP